MSTDLPAEPIDSAGSFLYGHGNLRTRTQTRWRDRTQNLHRVHGAGSCCVRANRRGAYDRVQWRPRTPAIDRPPGALPIVLGQETNPEYLSPNQTQYIHLKACFIGRIDRDHVRGYTHAPARRAHVDRSLFGTDLRARLGWRSKTHRFDQSQ